MTKIDFTEPLPFEKTFEYIISDPEFLESQKWDLEKMRKIISKI